MAIFLRVYEILLKTGWPATPPMPGSAPSPVIPSAAGSGRSIHCPRSRCHPAGLLRKTELSPPEDRAVFRELCVFRRPSSRTYDRDRTNPCGRDGRCFPGDASHRTGRTSMKRSIVRRLPAVQACLLVVGAGTHAWAQEQAAGAEKGIRGGKSGGREGPAGDLPRQCDGECPRGALSADRAHDGPLRPDVLPLPRGPAGRRRLGAAATRWAASPAGRRDTASSSSMRRTGRSPAACRRPGTPPPASASFPARAMRP